MFANAVHGSFIRSKNYKKCVMDALFTQSITHEKTIVEYNLDFGLLLDPMPYYKGIPNLEFSINNAYR